MLFLCYFKQVQPHQNQIKEIHTQAQLNQSSSEPKPDLS